MTWISGSRSNSTWVSMISQKEFITDVDYEGSWDMK